MNKNLLCFLVGAVAGGLSSWLYARKYFGDIVEDTVRKCNAVEAEDQPKIGEKNKEAESETSKAPVEPQKEGDGLVRYNKAIEENGYSDKSAKKGPYVIGQDEYRDGTMLTSVTWSYFEDGVVTDEYDNIVDDVEQAIGEDFVDAFGDEDIAYVRNEDRKCDYEILREGVYYNDPSDTED